MAQGSLVSKVAARMGKAEFFDPLILTVPAKARPPCTMILSIPSGHEAPHSLVIVFYRNVAKFLGCHQIGDPVSLVKSNFQNYKCATSQNIRRILHESTDDS